MSNNDGTSSQLNLPEITASSSDSFVNSIGVVTHIDSGAPNWLDASLVESEVAFLGVKNIRDGTPYDWALPEYVALAQMGVKFDLEQVNPTAAPFTVVGSLQDTERADTLEDAVPGSVESMEGANEYNINSYTLDGQVSYGDLDWGILDDQDLQAAVEADPLLADMPVVAASTGASSVAPYVSPYVDASNWHVYAGVGEQLESAMASGIATAEATAPGKPVYVTETGISSSGYGTAFWGVTDDVTQGIIDTNALLDGYQDGAAKTFLYELMDDENGTAQDDAFGLFTADGTPKLAAVDVSNLISLLSDSGSGSVPLGALAYGISNLPTTASSMLLEKSSGVFDIVFWNGAAELYNGSTDVTPPATTLTVTLDHYYQAIDIYDPVQGLTAIASSSNADTVSFALSEDPIIVEVGPPSTVESVADEDSVMVTSGSFVISAATPALSGGTIGASESEYILNAGSASDTAVQDGGQQFVSSGGSAFDTLVGDGGKQFVLSGGTAVDSVIDSGGTEIVSAGGLTAGAVVSAGGLIILSSGGIASGIALNSGGAVDIPDLTYVSGGMAQLDNATDVLSVLEGGRTYTQQLDGGYTGAHFDAAQDNVGGTTITNDGTACYCRGTRILTQNGEAAIESLRIGDLLITRSGRPQPIRWVGRRNYYGRSIAGRHMMVPVCIKADAIETGVPSRDLWVSPGHAIYLDGKLVPAWRLLNGISVIQPEAADQVTYLHVELDNHDVIIAENCAAESFIDDNCRYLFSNAAEFNTLYPGIAAKTRLMCAPRVEEGFELQTIQRRIAARAGIVPTAPKPGHMRGFVDHVGSELVCGWAQDIAQPEEPVVLDIIVNCRHIMRVLANAYRADLLHAGLGTGAHAFTARLPAGFAGRVEVRRASDHAELPLTHEALLKAA